MQLIYFEESEKFIIIDEKYCARIHGCIFYNDVNLILCAFLNDEYMEWEKLFINFYKTDFTVLGTFDGINDLKEKFPEYLI